MGRVQAAIALASLGLACFGSTNCVDVQGGAIELSWQIRDASGTVLTCKESGITAMRLIVRQTGDGGVGTTVPDPVFDCTRDVATTRFVYPAGSYDITLQPLCPSEPTPPVCDPPAPDGFACAVNYEVPPSIQRDVRTGQLVELNALLVVIRDPHNLACSVTTP